MKIEIVGETRRRLACLLGFSLAAAVFSYGQAKEADRPCPPSRSMEYYFPQGTFQDSWDGSDAFHRGWYSSHLRRMDEPSLSCGSLAGVEEYRFIWLRSFHEPVAVRIGLSGSEIRLHAVMLNGKGGYDPGRVGQRVDRGLSSGEWEELLSAMKKIPFWDLPTVEPEEPCVVPESGEVCLIVRGDGAQWILEGRRGGHYHVVDRWSGNDGIEAIGLLFLRMSGLSADPVY